MRWGVGGQMTVCFGGRFVFLNLKCAFNSVQVGMEQMRCSSSMALAHHLHLYHPHSQRCEAGADQRPVLAHARAHAARAGPGGRCAARGDRAAAAPAAQPPSASAASVRRELVV